MEEKVFNCKYAAMTAGDKTAFAEIYDEMKKTVYTLILRIVKRRAVAEDVMQELFLRLWRDGEKEHIKKPRSYIFMMARTMAIDELRHAPVSELEEEFSDGRLFADAVIEKLDIEAALSLLPCAERETVVLHINAGLKFREISDVTSVPLGTALYRYHSAIKKLRKLL